MTQQRIRIGTRGSALALWQSSWVASQLRELGVSVDVEIIQTQGDVNQAPIGQIGGEGLFTKRLQQALLEDEIDVAVHSLKDLPTEPIGGLTLAAVPPRESTGDVLVSNDVSGLDALPDGAVVGTGSMRRQAQLLHVRPDLNVQGVRGNVDTRLRKLDEGQFNAIVLAEAGLKRLDLHDRITHVLPREQMMPAVGQGALGIETRDNDTATLDAVLKLDDSATHCSVVAERAMLAALRGGCLAPVGAWGRVESEELRLDGVVLSSNGQKRITAAATGDPDDAIRLGQSVAEQLLNDGAGELIHESRSS